MIALTDVTGPTLADAAEQVLSRSRYRGRLPGQMGETDIDDAMKAPGQDLELAGFDPATQTAAVQNAAKSVEAVTQEQKAALRRAILSVWPRRLPDVQMSVTEFDALATGLAGAGAGGRSASGVKTQVKHVVRYFLERYRDPR